MNDKERLIESIISNVIKCCTVTSADGKTNITKEDVVGKSREDHIVMTRCLVVEQLIHRGFSINTIAFLLNRTIQAVRYLCKFVKNTLDDIDSYDGIVFNRWYAGMCSKGVSIDWYDYR